MEKSRMEQLQGFLAEDPADVFTRYLLALEYLKFDERNEALPLLKQVIEADKAYLAAYYQLGKLQELLQQKEEALSTYETGMQAARNKRDNHAYNELRFAYNSLAGIEDDDE